jgi:hypothetical protein
MGISDIERNGKNCRQFDIATGPVGQKRRMRQQRVGEDSYSQECAVGEQPSKRNMAPPGVHKQTKIRHELSPLGWPWMEGSGRFERGIKRTEHRRRPV